MRFALEPLLEAQQVVDLRMELLAEADAWRPGVETAGWIGVHLCRASSHHGWWSPCCATPWSSRQPCL